MHGKSSNLGLPAARKPAEDKKHDTNSDGSGKSPLARMRAAASVADARAGLQPDFSGLTSENAVPF
jgi:hypothetical protein